MATRPDEVWTSQCRIERGLYAFRYRSGPADPTPRADLRVVSGPVTFLMAPGRASAQLARQGEVVVLVAEAPGIIEVSLRGGDRTAAAATSFALDLLDRGGDASGSDAGSTTQATMQATTPAPMLKPSSAGLDPDGSLFGMEAHVSRLGDVRVPSGAWIAGPDLPLPIEGLTLLGGRRAPDIEMQVRSAAGPNAWSPWVGSGQFAGTRQRAECLTGVRLRLDEARGSGRTIAAEALFLGAAVVRKEGAFVEFTGIDPLVGLKLDVRTGLAASTGADRPAPGRVRVFKRSDLRPTTSLNS